MGSNRYRFCQNGIEPSLFRFINFESKDEDNFFIEKLNTGYFAGEINQEFGRENENGMRKWSFDHEIFSSSIMLICKKSPPAEVKFHSKPMDWELARGVETLTLLKNLSTFAPLLKFINQL